MKRTRKWGFVRQEAARLADLGLAPSLIAKRLGVDKSSVTRWIAAGKLKAPTKRTRRFPSPPASGAEVARNPKSPAEWAAAVRAEYQLDATDDQLVTLGESALLLSRDMDAKAHVRLAAAARFQAIAKQLALVARVEAGVEAPPEPVQAPEQPARPRPVPQRRLSGDPRALLQVVS